MEILNWIENTPRVFLLKTRPLNQLLWSQTTKNTEKTSKFVRFSPTPSAEKVSARTCILVSQPWNTFKRHQVSLKQILKCTGSSIISSLLQKHPRCPIVQNTERFMWVLGGDEETPLAAGLMDVSCSLAQGWLGVRKTFPSQSGKEGHEDSFVFFYPFPLQPADWLTPWITQVIIKKPQVMVITLVFCLWNTGYSPENENALV